MKRASCLSFIVAIMCLITPFAAAFAEDRLPSQVDLRGIWDMVVTEGEYGSGHRWDHTMLDAHLDITIQNGGIVHATFHARLDDDWAHDGETAVSERAVEMLGVISWSGDTVIFTSHGQRDHWVFHARIVNSRTMELMAYETGDHGWVSRNLAIRR